MFEPVELFHVSVQQDVVQALADELREGGLGAGKFYIGFISEPNSLYFLWHQSGAVPVATTLHREKLADAATARQAAQEFLSVWHSRAA